MDASLLDPATPEVEARGHIVEAHRVEIAQLRIEQRVVIRVPRGPQLSRSPMSDVRKSLVERTFAEKKIGKCLPMDSLRTVQVESGRYLGLVTRDNRYIRARLEKRCQARSFYSGFYMEKSQDGNMCVDRDLLHSRTGTKCEIDRLRELVLERMTE